MLNYCQCKWNIPLLLLLLLHRRNTGCFIVEKSHRKERKTCFQFCPVAKNPPVPPKENNFLHIESKTCKAVDRTRRTGGKCDWTEQAPSLGAVSRLQYIRDLRRSRCYFGVKEQEVTATSLWIYYLHHGSFRPCQFVCLSVGCFVSTITQDLDGGCVSAMNRPHKPSNFL